METTLGKFQRVPQIKASSIVLFEKYFFRSLKNTKLQVDTRVYGIFCSRKNCNESDR